MGRWQKLVVPRVIQELKTFSYKPTIRGMFYLLASDKSGQQVLQNTFKEYKGFIEAMSVARRNGDIPIDAFADDTRAIYDIRDKFETPSKYIDIRVYLLKNAGKYYFDSIPMWHKQEHYVEIWCEKAALRGLFISIVESEKLQVRVIVNKGWSSMPYRQANIKRLLEKSKKGDVDSDGKAIEKQFHVLYFGDYDPSGRRMDMNISLDLVLAATKGLTGAKLEKKSRQLRDGIESYDGELDDLLEEAEELELFKRIALTKPQITEYGLRGLENPDPKVMEKLQRDSNREAFIRENGSLFQIEVDALQKDPRFKDLIIDSVNDYFDQDVYDTMMEEYTVRDVKNELRNKIIFLDDDPFPTYKPYLDELSASLKRDMEDMRRERERRSERRNATEDDEDEEE
jgi:hypothetical protein